MNDTLIVTVYVILDDLLRAMGQRTDRRARTSDSDTAQRYGIDCQAASIGESRLR